MATKPIPNQIEKKVITCDVFKCTYFLPGLRSHLSTILSPLLCELQIYSIFEKFRQINSQVLSGYNIMQEIGT